MISTTKDRAPLVLLMRWSGRLLALGLFFFWGAFFVEHLAWFVHAGPRWPQAWVWLLQLAHLIMLAGLVVLLRREVLGSVITVLSSLTFFGFAAGNRFPAFVALTILPAVLILAARLLQPTAFQP